MKLSQIAELPGVDVYGAADGSISRLLTDSRVLVFPEDSLFFAISSERNNGHRYIDELYHNGVRAFVVSELPDCSLYPGAVFFRVDDTLSALQTIAALHRTSSNARVIGITGSNGKTIVKEWLYQLLNFNRNIVRSPRSYNSQLGVALSVWLLQPDTELGIFEAGISLPGEMAKLQPVIRPDVGIFTMIGDAHQENFSSLKEKIIEKIVLFRDSSVVIYCSDHHMVCQVLNESNLPGKLIDWGKRQDATVRILDYVISVSNTTVKLEYNKQGFTFHIPFTDNASVENALHCVVYMLYEGFNEQTINDRLSLLESVAMRLEVKEGIQECVVINDSYNSDVDALQIALDFLNQQASSKSLSKTLVLSDIFQSSYKPRMLYRKIAGLARAHSVVRFIGVGSEILQHRDLFDDFDARFFTSTEEMLRSEVTDTFRHEAILLKGARAFHFETISARLEKVAHETTLEVNLNNLIFNLNYFRSKLLPGTKIMCMVKAFAYGSGSVEIARVLQHHRVDALAVAVADEGAELRDAGIHIPIVVMNPEKSVFDLLFEHQLEPEIYSFKLLREFIAAAARRGIQSYPVHLKIDSGMHRLGFIPQEIPELLELLKHSGEIMVKSVFSHLAGADTPELDYFTSKQEAVFTNCANQIRNGVSYPVIRHLLNSAGIERFPEFQFEMVRLGIGHYGISALPEMSLPQVCTLKTIILQLKDIAPGETVGYNRKGIVDTPKRIAVLPIGYADGFDRKLSNGVGEVYIKGMRAPVIGNVSMDLISVDVTGLDVAEGDSVEVFGEHITISEIAIKTATIPYEILTGISRRVKRVYFQE